MKKLWLLGFIVAACTFGFPHYAQKQTLTPVAATELRAAAAKAIERIQHSQVVWYKKQTCSSCHHQLLAEVTLKFARDRGIPVNETVAKSMTVESLSKLNDLDTEVQGHDYIDVFLDSEILATAGQVGVKPNLTTAAYAQFIASRQLADGSWPTSDNRPPQASSMFASSAVSAAAVRQYLPAQFKAEQASRLQKARAWLLKAQPHTTEDRTYQLLGLLWTGADANARQQAARQLLSEQRADGGWAQLPTLASDAYATGEVLYALHQAAGLKTGDAVYQRGLRFLLGNQQPDGTWRVASRLHPPAPVSPPYVDTEFPTGHDQFISIMATSWAVNALLQPLPVTAKPGAPLELATKEQAEWMRVALNGNAADLKKLLDAGMQAESKTAEGTTALMLAARDLEKVKLLLARGANVNARTATGISPLMVAARYQGNNEVVKLLLQKGAQPNADGEVRNNASAFFYAVMVGDVQIAQTLVTAGANPKQKFTLLGTMEFTPLVFAATLNSDLPMTEFLLSHGVDPNETDGENISVLSSAAFSNRANVMPALIKAGAKVNHVDNLGMTPLLYAASVDFGDTAVLETLIAAGADLHAQTKQGQTALDLARGYHYAKAVTLLSNKIAAR